MTSATLKVQGDSIRYLVNSSETPDDARDRYSRMEGIDLSKDVADEIFETELQNKFPPMPTSQQIQASIEDLEKKLRSCL